MLDNIDFAFFYFVSSLFAIKPNILLMILLLVEMEELTKVGVQLSFTAACFLLISPF